MYTNGPKIVQFAHVGEGVKLEIRKTNCDTATIKVAAKMALMEAGQLRSFMVEMGSCGL